MLDHKNKISTRMLDHKKYCHKNKIPTRMLDRKNSATKIKYQHESYIIKILPQK
jgi:hypothetical protein